MSLFSEWNHLINNQTDATIHDFWKEYSETETRIYADILAHHTEKHEGVMKDLVAKYKANPVIYMGFLDGINSSLKTELELEPMDEDSFVSLDIDYEKLLFNMYKADAKYLYGLDEWNNIFTPEKREEIHKEYRNSRTVHRESPKIGRNDPCPCGSGKKYKNCCGKN